MPSTAIVWFRQDLRLRDHLALAAALVRHERILPLYVHSPEESGVAAPGAAARWWLHHSLIALQKALRERGSDLLLRRGPSLAAIEALLAETGATAVFWQHRYEPTHSHQDRLVKQALQARDIACHSDNGALLAEPWEIKTRSGGDYRVFTPFMKALQARGLPRRPLPAPVALPPLPPRLASLAVADLALLPRIRWDTGIAGMWTPGESAAQARLQDFVQSRLTDYEQARDRPDLDGTSRLSAALHFGEISAVDTVFAVQALQADPAQASSDRGCERFIAEIGWREFGYHLLFRYPETVTVPFDRRFLDFPWRATGYDEDLVRWQQGQTGIPIIDAGMRQLWHIGWMHNRVRMLVASLLTKNLLIPWQCGETWFRETLVDADLASNVLGWQWTAGCGVDAAPYFRLFNPVTQSERFDPARAYIRQWVPELAKLPDRVIHRPWQASTDELRSAGVVLGKTYPWPCVDLMTSRTRVLDAYKGLQT